jgi:hypothetical protein
MDYHEQRWILSWIVNNCILVFLYSCSHLPILKTFWIRSNCESPDSMTFPKTRILRNFSAVSQFSRKIRIFNLFSASSLRHVSKSPDFQIASSCPWVVPILRRVMGVRSADTVAER